MFSRVREGPACRRGPQKKRTAAAYALQISASSTSEATGATLSFGGRGGSVGGVHGSSGLVQQAGGSGPSQGPHSHFLISTTGSCSSTLTILTSTTFAGSVTASGTASVGAAVVASGVVVSSGAVVVVVVWNFAHRGSSGRSLHMSPSMSSMTSPIAAVVVAVVVVAFALRC